MNSEQMHGHLRAMKGWALEGWGRVTHDPWMRLAGRREQLLGRLEASLADMTPGARDIGPDIDAKLVRHGPKTVGRGRRARESRPVLEPAFTPR